MAKARKRRRDEKEHGKDEKQEAGDFKSEEKQEEIKEKQKTQRAKRWQLFQRDIELIEKDEDFPLPSKEQGNAFLVGMVGRRKSGKTFLLDLLMKTIWRREFNKIYVLSKTAKFQDYFKTWKGEIKYIEQWSKEFFDELKAEAEKSGLKKKFLVIIDDMSSNMREDMYATNVDEFAFIGRHLKISVVWLAQKITLFTPGFRQECDAFILFREENMQELRLLHREWGFGEMNDFIVTLIENVKERYSWIMIRNVGGTVHLFRLPSADEWTKNSSNS